MEIWKIFVLLVGGLVLFGAPVVWMVRTYNAAQASSSAAPAASPKLSGWGLSAYKMRWESGAKPLWWWFGGVHLLALPFIALEREELAGIAELLLLNPQVIVFPEAHWWIQGFTSLGAVDIVWGMIILARIAPTRWKGYCGLLVAVSLIPATYIAMRGWGPFFQLMIGD